MKTHIIAYPRIGADRELKKIVEKHWKGQASKEELLAEAKTLRLANWQTQVDAGLDFLTVNDFSFYDQVLDHSQLLGIIPKRFENQNLEDLDLYFSIARGLQEKDSCCSGHEASPMVKWFDTNYHYLVPEFHEALVPKLNSEKVISEIREAKAAFSQDLKVALISPFTYLKVSRLEPIEYAGWLELILPLYKELLQEIKEEGVRYVQFDEPALSLNLSSIEQVLIKEIYNELSKVEGLELIVANYFGELKGNLETFLSLPVETLHIDAVRAEDEVELVLNKIPAEKKLSLGLVNGRNIWINDYQKSLKVIDKAFSQLGGDRLLIASSCSLQHVPVSLQREEKLDPTIKSYLAFAEEKLAELVELKAIHLDEAAAKDFLTANQAKWQSRRQHKEVTVAKVQQDLASLKDEEKRRSTAVKQRLAIQKESLNLPDLPTTTIGSFPQTKEVRSHRAQYRKGSLSQEAYDQFVADEIRSCIEFQDEAGLDVLVHGEFERNDMVEYFGELLEGFCFTEFAWVQSYGTRCVKPPILFGAVYRSQALTVDWSVYAQTLTNKYLKGMLTGPVTILQWSFVRDDQPRSTTCRQIALAIRDEVEELEEKGIRIIQIDEPAFREGLPLREEDKSIYIDWALESFRISSARVQPSTQIHTHMCYSEFNEIIEAISDLDADVISIETSRSKMSLLDDYSAETFTTEIGPGVYDIHSPRVPSEDEQFGLIQKALEKVPVERLWINPDCGLKTRGWQETKASLINLVRAAEKARAELAVLA